MIDKNAIVVSTAYFPPIQYFTHFITGNPVKVEVHENYIKQSYRNRCKIYSPNGLQILTVPVERGSFHKVNIGDLRIDYSKEWRANHLKALRTAYNSSAFYEFLIDDIAACIMKEHKLLIDLNMDLLMLILDMMELDNDISVTEEFIPIDENNRDLRYSIHPKKPDKEFIRDLPTYFQVFSAGSGFIPDLSILDLLFNMGPESYSYLLSCTKKQEVYRKS